MQEEMKTPHKIPIKFTNRPSQQLQHSRNVLVQVYLIPPQKIKQYKTKNKKQKPKKHNK